MRKFLSGVNVVNGVLSIGTVNSGSGDILTYVGNEVRRVTASQLLSYIGAIGGTISQGQVAFGTGVNTVGGDVGLTWDNINKFILVTNGTGLSTKYGTNVIEFLRDGTSFIGNYSTNGALDIYGQSFIKLTGTSYVDLYTGGSGTPILRANSTGNILIGTTTDVGEKLQVNGLLRSNTIRLTADASNTSAHRIAVYDSGTTSYGMMLWNSNGTAGEWSTMIYGPNQANRRISFGKVTGASFAVHSDVTEFAYFDLDDYTLRLTADAYVNSNRVFHDGYHPNADTWTTARTLTIGSTGKSVNGSANVSWSLAEIGAAAASHTHTWGQIDGTFRAQITDVEIVPNSGFYRRSTTSEGFVWHGRLNSGGEAVQLNLGRENGGTLRWRDINSDASSYSSWKIAVDTTRSVTAGTGLTGGGDFSANRTLSFDTTWGDLRYALASHTHPASQITAGTFAAGDFTFQNDIQVNGNEIRFASAKRTVLHNGHMYLGDIDNIGGSLYIRQSGIDVATVSGYNWTIPYDFTINGRIAEVKGKLNTFYNNLGSPMIEEYALIHGQMNNKFRFISPALQEESTDGITWTTSTRASANQLGDMMRGEGEGTVISAIPAPSLGGTGYYRLTWNASQTGYVFLNKLYVYCSTSGNQVEFTIERKHNTNGWQIVTSGTLSNWPGHIFCPHTSIPFSTNPSQYGEVRVTFRIVSATYTNPFTLYAIEWLGGYPAGKRNVESYDRNKNVTFPNQISSNGFIKVGGTSSQFLKADGSVDSTTYATASAISGTTNYLSKFTASGTIGNSAVYESGGNVGIGTTNPLGNVHISGGTGSAVLILQADVNNTVEASNPKIWFNQDGDFNEAAIQLNASNELNIISNVDGGGGIVFRTGQTDNTGSTDPINGALERMRITPTGNVLINTSTDSGDRLRVDGTVRFDSIANATGDFVTIDASNVLKRRTAAEVKTDLGLAGNYVTLDTVQTVTAQKTFSGKAYFESVFINTIHDAGTISSGFYPVQADTLSSVRKITLGGNFSMSTQAGTAGAVVRLYLIQDGTGNRTLSWVSGGASVTWANGGTAPVLSTAAGAVDLVILTWLSSSVIYGEFRRGATETISASSITSGTLAVARGGTGISSYTTGNYLRASGATALEQRTPAQVLSDIGAAAASHTQSASTITAGTFASGDFAFQANLSIGGQVYSPAVAKGNSGTAVTFNWNDGNIQTVTLTGNATFTFSNPQSGASYQIIITQDATGGRTITFPTVKWEGGAAPSLTGTANSIDIVTLTYNGSSYFGVISKNHA